MSNKEFNFPLEKFWLDEKEPKIKDGLKIDRSNLFEILRMEIDPKEETYKLTPATGESDDLKVVNSLDNKKADINAYNHISDFNQLGIKDYLLNKRNRYMVHTRKNHSIGTAIIGRLYFHALKPFISYTYFREIDMKIFEKLLLFALYLHDVGHLPFSHLIEGVFDEINWTRIKGKPHKHDEAPLEQLSPNEKEKIKEAIKENIGKDGDINIYFELVQDLIAGISGIPFLDAIVNSSIDADKIDYIFRDMEFTGKRARLREDITWLKAFLSNISLSPEGLVRLNGEASLCALELLEERMFLYRGLYLDPKIRAFEKIASVVIVSWLTTEISKALYNQLRNSKDSAQDTEIIFKSSTPDYRAEKGGLAYEKLIKKFYDCTEPKEIRLLSDMCKELMNVNDPFRDNRAKEWFGTIKKWFDNLGDPTSEFQLEKECYNLIVEEPFYINKEDVEKARDIARNIFVDYPCGVLFDIVEYPRFLPSSRSRRFTIHDDEIISEVFLVPDKEPSKWSRKKIGKFPLHACDFTSLEKKFAQVVIINTVPDEIRGEYFYDLFKRESVKRNIKIIPSIWG